MHHRMLQHISVNFKVYWLSSSCESDKLTELYGVIYHESRMIFTNLHISLLLVAPYTCLRQIVLFILQYILLYQVDLDPSIS